MVHRLAITLLLVGLTPHVGMALTADVRRDTEWLAAFASRVPGAEGHTKAGDELLERLEAIPNAHVWTHGFPVTAPVVQRAELIVDSGAHVGTHAIYPVWPDLVRLKTTGEDGLHGDFVYVGDGKPGELSPQRLRGQIAVMEMSAAGNWKRPFDMGAKALLFLGGPDDRAPYPSQQPLYWPRYYVPEGPLAEALRRGETTSGTIHCDAEWRIITARNFYLLVTPETPTDLEPMALAAPYDSMSVVMGLAPGADNAVDAAFLLNLARRFSERPPDRPLLFGFIDAYGFNQLGVRQMLAMLTVTPNDKNRQEYVRQDRERLEEYEELVAQLEELGTGREALDRLWDKKRYRELQRCFKDTIGPEILNMKEEAGDLRVLLHEDQGKTPALQQDLNVAVARQRRLNRILSQVLEHRPIDDDKADDALAMWASVSQRVVGQFQNLRSANEYFTELDRLRNGIGEAMGRDVASQPAVAFLLGIDLSDAGVVTGPGPVCEHLQAPQASANRDFVRWIRRLLKRTDDPFWSTPTSRLAQLGWTPPDAGPEGTGTGFREAVERSLHLDAIRGLEDPYSFSIGRLALLSSPAESFLLPAATWTTVGALRPRLDTPQDRAEHLDWDRLNPQIATTALLVEHLASDPAFAPVPKSSDMARAAWRMPRGTVVAESVAETVPRTPMPDFLATLVGNHPLYLLPDGAVGVRRNEFVPTGPDGRFVFPPMPTPTAEHITLLKVQAFDLDDRARIVRAISDSATLVAGRVSSSVNLRESPSATPARVVAFRCQELNGPEFFDPRYLEALSGYSLIDVRRGGTPKRYHFSVRQGQMSGLLRPGSRWQLLLRIGSAANRMVLMNVNPALAQGHLSLAEAIRTGFSLEEPLPTIPTLVSARDLYAVDSWRLDRFRKAGISSEAIDTLHEATAAHLQQADAALAADDGSALVRSANSALANEIRAYEALRATGDDVTRGAIFLMLLLAPFSLAMERLLFAATRIGRQIAGSMGIFVSMSLVLWSFHPAFRITSQPIIIVMAFAILLLSLLVIIMIMRKFEGDLEEMRSGRAEASGAQISRGGVIGSAIWLGIANMRKRKVRTALTGTTIVLITFALLCFSSSSQYQDKRQFTLRNRTSPYPGLLIRQPRMRTMVSRSLDTVANLLAERVTPVPRYWWVSPYYPTWRLHVRHAPSGQQVSLKAGLGLTGEERYLTRPDRFVSQWERFANGEGCYLSESTARQLGIAPGDEVLVAGQSLELLDTFDASRIERELTMLDGQSLLPFDYSIEREASTLTQEGLAAQLATGAGLEPDMDVNHVPGDEVILLPATLVKRLGGSLRNIGVRVDEPDDPAETAQKLAKVIAFPMYYGKGDDVNVLVSTPLLPRPPRDLAVPLLIAALIIFNTMLNSLAERKKEIHIYTSLGLAPRHVGILFLAEAVTYGLMGSILGYIVGQGLATVLAAQGWMGGITLNYSGSNVIMTMGLVLLVVILSATVPAIMAGKMATPSKEMNWSVPRPVDGTIRDLLPFTVTRRAAKGLVAFIHEYLEAHREGSIGGFTADHLSLLPSEHERLAGVRGTVWLAPYDLGVRQEVQIEVRPEEEDVCSIHLELKHGTGQPKTWWRLNKAFLTDVRRQILGWRQVTPERVMEYIRNAE